ATRSGKLGDLSTEAIAGMNAPGPRAEGSANALVAAQVAFPCRPRANLHHLICQARERRLQIRGGGGGNRAHAKPASGADDAQRNLAAIGNEDLLQHGPRLWHCPSCLSNWRAGSRQCWSARAASGRQLAAGETERAKEHLPLC